MRPRFTLPALTTAAWRAPAIAMAAALLAHAPQAVATTLSNAPDPIPHIERIPLNDTATPLQLHIYLPQSTKLNTATRTARRPSGVVPGAQRGPFPILLYAHGRPAYASERAKFKRPIHARHVHYWLSKGYAVVAPIRPGYGRATPAGNINIAATKDPESSGVGYSASGQCLRPPSLEQPTQNAAAAQRAALNWVRQQPWAQANHIVLEGQSVGGLATVALCATNPPGVKACINFSGGAGGDPQHAPGKSCAPDHTAQLMRQYGRTTRAPSLWLYAPNDLYWGAQAPQQWFEAFNRAAAEPPLATPATFYQSPPIGSDGHSLHRAGSKHWAAPLDAWLKQYGL